MRGMLDKEMVEEENYDEAEKGGRVKVRKGKVGEGKTIGEGNVWRNCAVLKISIKALVRNAG